MNPEEIVAFLEQTKLFAGFSKEEIESLLPFTQIYSFQKGEWICQEGEKDQSLFLLKTGKAEVLKEEKEYKQYEQLAILEPGDYFGEMAHLENEKRSASIKAAESTEVLAIDLNSLEKVPAKQPIYSKIIVELGKKVSRHLRNADEKLISALSERLRILQSFNQISKTIVQIFILGAIWFNFSRLIDLFPLVKPIIAPLFSAVFILFFAISVVYIIKSSGYPLSFYGLTLNRWGEFALQGVLYSIPFLVFLVVLKWILINNINLFKGIPLLGSPHATSSILWMSGVYILTTPIQELIARGFLQSCFRNFFQSSNRAFLAILTSNLLFQMLHTVKGFWLGIASFILGIFWGLLFEQQKSLVGVCVSHAIIGVIGFFLLDYDTLIGLAG